MRGSGSTTGASAYGSIPRTYRASFQPPPSGASPSNIIDVDEDNGDGDDDGDGAKAPATSTSARRCRSVASAPARLSRSLAPFAAQNYSQSGYAGSSKGKGGASPKGGKGASNHLEVSGWNQSSWVDDLWKGEPNASKNESSWVDNLWSGEPNAPNNELWVNQSLLSNASKTQASTRTNESTSYLDEEDDDDTLEDGTYRGGTYNPGTEDNLYAAQSWSSPPPSYDSVRRPETLWQPYYMEQYEHEIETVDELQHLGTFGMKPPYQFGTHEYDALTKEYTKPDPQVLVIASSLIAGQRRGDHILSPLHAEVVSKKNPTI